VRKGGFISLRGPAGGGVVVTRRLLWPGGDLVINADASDGEMQFRVSDGHRTPISAFDHEDCAPFTADSTAHTVRWSGRSLDELAGRAIRLEIAFRDADLYTIRASGGDGAE
jgi:hypothetical protein